MTTQDTAEATTARLAAQIWVLLSTVGVLLALAVPWFAGPPGLLTLLVVLAVLACGAAVFRMSSRWAGLVLVGLAVLLALALFVVAVSLTNEESTELLTGFWCTELLLAAGAFAWGHWSAVQHEFPGEP